MISGGPRLLAVISAISSIEEIVMYDIFPGPLEATADYMNKPEKYWDEYAILRDEIEFLDERELKPRLDDSLIRLCLRGGFEPAGDFDCAMAEDVALHPPPKKLNGKSDHTLPIILYDAYKTLKVSGKFVFTAYPGLIGESVIEDGLLDSFQVLVNNPDIILCEDGKWLNVDKAAEYLSSQAGKYKENKSKYWLGDLSRVRMYNASEVNELAGDRFNHVTTRNIPGGMFPFAKRYYHILFKRLREKAEKVIKPHDQ